MSENIIKVENMVERHYLYFYNGYYFPKIFNIINATLFEKLSNQNIEYNFKSGKNIQQQIEEYTTRLKSYLTLLRYHCYIYHNQDPTLSQKEWENLQLFTEHEKEVLATDWCVNILSLIRLKAIKDDDLNGVCIIPIESQPMIMKRGFLKLKDGERIPVLFK
jgi:hypothetical protein